MIESLGVNWNMVFFKRDEKLFVYEVEVLENILVFKRHKVDIGTDLRPREHCEWTQIGEGVPTTVCSSTVTDDDRVVICSRKGDHLFKVYIPEKGRLKWVKIR
jgi:hypothetical protein